MISDLSKRIARLGIDTLLPMQQEMSTVRLPSKILLCAPTGSGKTLAFAIGILRSLPKIKTSGVKVLVIAPTRELVLQIFDIVRILTAPEYKTTALYGGHSFAIEARSLDGNPDIVVGTPGRILDHIRRGRLDLKGVGTLVIDEYDKALELGFSDDMRSILRGIRKVDTLILTSATRGEIPPFVTDAVDRELDYSHEAAEVPENRIETFRIDSPSPDKLETLDALLRMLSGQRTMVFVNHRDAAERVATYLRKRGFPAILYHGGLEQQMRERALILFENGTCPIMVSTDLAARGLDIAGVGAVIHYHLPVNEEAWTHRNGRTARMGAEGRAYVIVSEHDKVQPFVSIDDVVAEMPEIPAAPEPSKTATLFFNAGKKEKISRGDIAGFLIQKGGLRADEVGRIFVGEHCAYAAVPADKARATAEAVAAHKIKNTRVRVTQLKKLD